MEMVSLQKEKFFFQSGRLKGPGHLSSPVLYFARCLPIVLAFLFVCSEFSY